MTEEKRIEAGGLIYKNRLAMIGLIGIPTRPGIGGSYFSRIVDAGIHVDLIVNLYDGGKYDNILICVRRDDLDAALEVSQKVHEEIGSQSIIMDPEVALVSISSLDFDQSQVIAGHMFKTLGDNGINIEGISSSVSSVTCMIASQDLCEAVQVLREAFILP
ncbi:MAG: ACT domain-containing protein [Anaerolineales bacterium]